jgi:hypothetical protein
MADVNQADSAVPGRRPLVAIAAALSLFTATLLALPWALGLGLQWWLRENVDAIVTLDDVDFNPFTGVAALDELHITKDSIDILGLPRISLDVDWSPLLGQQLRLRSITVEGLALTIEQTAAGELLIGGFKLPADTEESSAEGWGYVLDSLQVRNSLIAYSSPDISLTAELNELVLTGLASSTEESAKLALSGQLNGATLQLQGELPPLPQGQRAFQGRLSLQKLTLDSFQELAREAGLTATGTLAIDSELSLQMSSQGTHVSLKGASAHIDNFSLASSGTGVSGTAINWRGDISIVAGESTSTAVNGSVSASDVALDIEDNAVQEAQFAGIEIEMLTYTETGDLTLKGVTLRQAEFGQEVAGTDPASEEENPSPLRAGLIAVDQIEIIDGDRISVGTLEWQDVESVGRRDEDGSWQLVRITETLPFAKQVDNEAASKPKGSIRIGELTITGDSYLQVSDYAVQPSFQMRLDLSQASMTAIDSAQPLQDSKLLVAGRIDEHSRVELEGTMRPFADTIATELSGHFEGIPLTQLSPYTVAAIGYELRSGQLDADSTFKLSGSAFESSNQLVFRGLEIKAQKRERRKKFDSNMRVPLGRALDLLRDRNNTIVLKLPINGDLESPDFNANDAIATAVSKGVKAGSLAFLKYTLQPYGTAITLAQIAGEAIMKVRLEPMLFAPGSNKIRAELDPYLVKVANILKARPAVNLKLCGVATEADKLAAAGASPAPGREADLLELARQRARQVKNRFVADYKIDPRRLVACQPAVDEGGADRSPRVELLI